MKSPIILIPGIQGTKLANINNKDFDTVWSGIRKFFDNLYDLILELDGRTDKQTEVIIERQDVEDLAYSEIINYLKHLGYPVYIFGYDWRKSNDESGNKLYEFVEVVRAKHKGNDKINFITHSMGCQVFSGFLKRLKEDQMAAVINRAIFTVPPFMGSVEAMFNIVIGKSKLFNSSDDFRKIETFPAIFELCPVYKDGTGEDTQQKMEVDQNSLGVKNQFLFSKEFESTDGDGTVHINSAKVFKDSITTLKVKSRWIEKRLDGRIIMADWHSFFLNNGRVQNILKRFMEVDKSNLSDNWYESIGGGVKLA